MHNTCYKKLTASFTSIQNDLVVNNSSRKWNCTMVLHFNCPETGKPFETADYSISDNRGIVTKANGDKILDATVMINSPCPHCGNLHKYRADKLACPFSPK